MGTRRTTIGRTLSSALPSMDNEIYSRTFTLHSGCQASFSLQTIPAEEVAIKTRVDAMINGRDQSSLTPDSLRDIVQTLKIQQFIPAIGVRRNDDSIEILDGSRRRAAALICQKSLEILVTDSDITPEDARYLAREIQTAREHNLREIGQQIQRMKDSGLSQKEIADIQGLSQAKVTRALQAAMVPQPLIALFPIVAELTHPDYKTLLDIASLLESQHINLGSFVLDIAEKIADLQANSSLAADEQKSQIMAMIRKATSQGESGKAEKTKTTALWQFDDKDRFARKKQKGRSFSYEFNRLPKTVQKELDDVIAETLKRHFSMP
ncbi:ParB family protein [Erwinia sp. HR93]|uniref:ParB family protein n=1 Tax=Erwinia sp. HR93 TaxID=3094840 RepID=UPI002ADEAB6A|nr:ParB family protein [Erwinia sp. HR93]MEA1064371.1 ParB family protein [Erwinia sp. HR93]